MKIVIAPDSFKESLDAWQVAQAIKQGFAEIYPQAEYLCLPMADGGEGTVAAMVAATAGQRISCQVTGPQHTPVMAFYGLLGDSHTAVIEMAAASGLHWVPADQRNPLYSTSYGTGELILAALQRGASHIILGIGGSATNDGGAGMMQALGVQWRNADGQPLPLGGAALADLQQIDITGLTPLLAGVQITLACDVDNPLCGPQGASAVFGPQKGATPAQVQQLDQALSHYAQQLEAFSGKTLATLPGSGAAGGLAVPLLALCDASLQSGVQIVIESLGLAHAVADADLVITGEGRIDSQTIYGKTPIGVARVAKQFSVPTIALVGGMSPDYGVVHQHGLDAVFSVVNRVVPLSVALEEAAENLRVTARNVAALWQAATKV